MISIPKIYTFNYKAFINEKELCYTFLVCDFKVICWGEISIIINHFKLKNSVAFSTYLQCCATTTLYLTIQE